MLITPCTVTTKGAMPSLKLVRYWHLDQFRVWMKNALRVLRDVRREFPGPGSMAWRISAAARLKEGSIAPGELNRMLSRTAAEAMKVVTAKEEA